MDCETIPSAHDMHLFHEGSLFRSYRMFGAHIRTEGGTAGVRFTVWAPNAAGVSVVGAFNGWRGDSHRMQRCNDSGLWSLFIPGLGEWTLYKYYIEPKTGAPFQKSDPYAFFAEKRPNTASIVMRLDGYAWQDDEWMERQQHASSFNRPLLIYEAHLGSWRVHGKEQFYTYDELSDTLIDYAVELGYTHLELLPLAEHPFDRSWGYQVTGYYAVTSRFGTPQAFMRFVERCHRRGIGVIMDWVPCHFCKDAHGLRLFDGEPVYEYADPRRAEKPQWGTLSFDYARPEVQSFLISNAMFWMDLYHIDGLRVDAVASMLSRNMDKPVDMWTYNEDGGTINRDAVAFLKKLNSAVFAAYPQALMIAEDSSDYPLVTAPVQGGGLGFNYKWNMGWMNDMLKYVKLDPEERRLQHNHRLITFSLLYAFSENFVLPLSHDEVVHGKRSLLGKMPGDYWRQFAGLRLLLGYMIGHPGKKLLFMGGEFGQFDEWKDLEQLDWGLLEFDMHARMRQYVCALQQLYRRERSLWEMDHDPAGFAWIDADNAAQSIVSFVRFGRKEELVVLCNFSPDAYHDYRIGVPAKGTYRELLNSDAERFGGSGVTNPLPLEAEAVAWHGRPHSIAMSVPPLGIAMLKRE
nr:1,4-alpha-glucan branching protein GlgB [Paenibacillus cymbidii]